MTQKDKTISETSETKSSLNGIIDGRAEADLCSAKPAVDLSNCTKTQNIEEEPMDTSDAKASTARSEPAPEVTSVSVKTEKGEARKSTTDEIQQALKNDQQAKIPLKKRGMKFSEDFDKNSCIIVQNPSVCQLKECPKPDSTPQQTNKAPSVNDHVNGEVKSASESELQSRLCVPLKDAVANKDVRTKSGETREEASPATYKKSESSSAGKVTKSADVDEKNPHLEAEKPPTEPLPSLKDASNDCEKSSHYQELENTKEFKSVSCKGVETTDKSLLPEESEKSTSESSRTEETKTTTEMKEKLTVKEMETCQTGEEKCDKCEEEPGTVQPVETQRAEKDPVEKTSTSDSEKAEILKVNDDTETRDVTQNCEANEPAVSKTSGETTNDKESVEASGGKRLDEEKQENIKDAEETQEKTSAAPEADDQDVRKDIDCGDGATHDGGKLSDSSSDSAKNQTKPQVDDKTERPEGEADGKDKPSSPDEKTDVSKENNQKMERPETEQAKNTEEERPSLERGNDAGKDNEEDVGSEELPSLDKESKAESTEERNDSKESETSDKMEETAQQNEPKDEKSATEAEMANRPVEDSVSEKPNDEKSKSKSETDPSAPKNEVENGEEARSDPRAAGIRQRAKRPAHRRKADVRRLERHGDSESDSNTGMSLRRSPRISRPTPKAVDIHDRKQEKPQAAPPPPEKREDNKSEKEKDEEEVEEVKAVQRKPRQKKADQEGHTKPKVLLPLHLLIPLPAFFFLYFVLLFSSSASSSSFLFSPSFSRAEVRIKVKLTVSFKIQRRSKYSHHFTVLIPQSTTTNRSCVCLVLGKV